MCGKKLPEGLVSQYQPTSIQAGVTTKKKGSFRIIAQAVVKVEVLDLYGHPDTVFIPAYLTDDEIPHLICPIDINTYDSCMTINDVTRGAVKVLIDRPYGGQLSPFPHIFLTQKHRDLYS